MAHAHLRYLNPFPRNLGDLFAKYDKVLIDPRKSIPVDFEQDNKLFIIPVEDIVAVFRKEAGAIEE